FEDGTQRFGVPRAQPQYVPIVDDQAQHGHQHAEDGATAAAALEDEVPTRRLPIYQSVLSRWFSEEQPDNNQDTSSQDTESDQQENAVGREWSSVSDAGWDAAESLWHPGEEETTSAGLPKRVPNAYLVPGSAGTNQASASPGFADTTTARPGEGAIARSADAARTRMMNFQRGYTKGRHALAENGSDEAAAAEDSGESHAADG